MKIIPNWPHNHPLVQRTCRFEILSGNFKQTLILTHLYKSFLIKIGQDIDLITKYRYSVLEHIAGKITYFIPPAVVEF
jgi:hypothetical protein